MNRIRLSFYVPIGQPPVMCLRPSFPGDLTDSLSTLQDVEREIRALHAELDLALEEARRRMSEWEQQEAGRKAGEEPSLF